MSRKFTESFDMQSLDQFTSFISAGVIASSLGGGEYALGLGGEINKQFASGEAENFFGFFVQPSNPVTPSQPVMAWRNLSTILGRIAFSAGRVLQAWVGTGGGEVLVGTGTTVWANSDSHHIQARALIDGTVGVIQVKVDDTLEIDFLGNTKPGAETTIDGFRMNIGDANYASMTVNNTIGVVDNGWPGVVRMRGRKPDRDGFYNEFDREPASPTTAFDKVDEFDPPAGPPDTSDFVSTDVNLEVQSFRFPSHGLINAQVLAKSYLYYMQKITSGEAVHGTRKISTGANIFDAAPRALSTSFRTERFRYRENPHTALPWTLTDAQDDIFESMIQALV